MKKYSAITEGVDFIVHVIEQAAKGQAEVLDFSWDERFITFGIPVYGQTFTWHFNLGDVASSLENMHEVEYVEYDKGTVEILMVGVHRGTFGDEVEVSEIHVNSYMEAFGFSELAGQMVHDAANEAMGCYKDREFGKFLGMAHQMGLTGGLIAQLSPKRKVAVA